VLSYARRDLIRNPRRTLAALAGVVLGVGLFSGVLFFIDGSAASMTKRAIAPLALDMQRVLTSPVGEGLRLDQRLATTGVLRAGERTRMLLTVRNLGAAPANEVVVNDRLTGTLQYVPGTATRGGKPIPDVAGQTPFAHGPARIGQNIGTVQPGARVELSYVVRPVRAVPDAGELPLQATISTRENLIPDRANAPDLVELDELRDQIASIPGVAAADELSFADLPPGSLRSGLATIDRPVRVFGFDRAYAEHYPSIRLAEGTFRPDSALLSPEASRALDTGPGAAVTLALPGGARPLELPVSGIADLSRANPLFNSREGRKLEDFLYIADSIVVSPEMFHDKVVPAFRAATAARGTALEVKNLPVLEVDVLVERSQLNSDPARALRQTEAIAKQIRGIAPEQDFLLDNVSNTLQVARLDARVAKRMFLFLGLPGLLLAAFLAAYAGSILASTQRREHANLRLRGAHRGHLVRILVYRTVAVAGAGSVLGTLAGFASVLAILGPSAFFAAAPGGLVVSALIATGAGVLATGFAMYVPGQRALGREVSGERRELAVEHQPAWRRLHLDLILVAAAALGAVIAVRAGAFDAPAGSVSTGEATSLPSHLLLLPLMAWFAGTLFSVRAFEGIATRLPVAAAPRFGPLVSGILSRSLRRRPRALVTGIVGVGLVTAFGTGLAVFAATYDAAKAADAKFTVGSNVRVTPSPLSHRGHPASYASELRVPGVFGATPVVARLENAFLKSDFNSEVKDLAAIDPDSFGRIAPLSDSFFPDGTAAEAMEALAADPQALLVESDTAEALKMEVGDTVLVLLARGTKAQQLREMTVAGLFDRFPGFPERLHLVANLAYYQAETGLKEVDFFLAKTTDQSDAGLTGAVSALQAGPAARDRLNIDSTGTAYNKDQSSLTALNIRGLIDLDSFYTLLMSGTVIAIFVFSLMLHRRREYVTLRAQGMPSRKLQALVLGEAAFVGLSGLVAGTLVGTGIGLLLVHVLEPLFILPPVGTAPWRDGALLAGLVVAATVASTLAALTILRRLSPSEVLREQ
jgi:putative ABC transport system permease protein